MKFLRILVNHWYKFLKAILVNVPLRSSARSPHQIAATVGSKDSPPVGNFSGVQIALRNVLGGIFTRIAYNKGDLALNFSFCTVDLPYD